MPAAASTAAAGQQHGVGSDLVEGGRHGQQPVLDDRQPAAGRDQLAQWPCAACARRVPANEGCRMEPATGGAAAGPAAAAAAAAQQQQQQHWGSSSSSNLKRTRRPADQERLPT